MKTKVFGFLIRALRGDTDQSTIAERAGVSGSCVSRIERGESDPTLTTILAISEALGLDIDVLMDLYAQAELRCVQLTSDFASFARIEVAAHLAAVEVAEAFAAQPQSQKETA